MADLTTPSAATIATSDATNAAPSGGKPKSFAGKPEKPDEEKFKQDVAKAEKEHAASQEKLNAIRAKLDNARPNNKDSPNAKRQAELKSQLAEIRQKQQGFKTSRSATLEKVKKLDEQLKSRMNELKTARSRVNFRTAEDVDREIQRLQKQVDTGTMKLVDEKKALAEISSLNKQKKNFSGFDAQQKAIEDLKAQIAELKKTLDDPEQKAISEQYNALQKELDGLKAEQDEAYKNVRALREQKDKAQAEQQEKWLALKQIKDAYFQGKRAYAEYEHQAYKARKERQRAEREAWEAEKKRKIANQKLEEASAPAYQEEILSAEGLIRFFDPSSVAAKETTGPSSKLAATATRTVDESGLKGTRLVKKSEDEESYFVGTGGKKGKKAKKNAGSPASTPTEGKFNLNIGIIEELGKLNVAPPATQADVPGVIEKLKEKVDFWKKDQDRKTKENIAKAKEEIARLEAETENGSKDTAKKPAQKNQGVNGTPSAEAELTQENDAAADVAIELQKTSIEDKA